MLRRSGWHVADTHTWFCFREELESATHRLNAHVTELTQRLCKTEVSLQANIHDYLSLRAQTLQSTRHMQEQLVAANCSRDDALLKLAEMQVPPRARTLLPSRG